MRTIVIIMLLATLYGCSGKQTDTQDAAPAKDTATTTATNVVVLTAAQMKNAGIETGKPEMRTMQTILKVNGLIDVPPQNMVTISFPSGGYLKSTSLLPGMQVKKGQVLAVLQDQLFVQMQEDFLMAKTKVAFLQKEYERQKLLNTTKATSDKVFEQTTSDYQSARITVNALKEKQLLLGINPTALTENNISRTVNIYSPISGYVAAVKVNIGKYVSPTDVLFELVNIDDLHLTLTVFEKDLTALQPGQLIKAYLTSDTTKSYEAKIVLISKTLDSNRSAEVHCHFTGSLPPLFPGMFMNAQIALTNNAVVAVPDDAVVRSGDSDYVFVERKPSQFEMMPVKVAVTQNGFSGIVTNNDALNLIIIKKNAYAALMKLKNTGEDEE